ncbi:MAG TPA: GDP-mannose 4,6-dehydratase [bacterium]|mgnify:CR=1 FL=1|nr:GDP-mannose 4,6-dehydratase [bacterium]
MKKNALITGINGFTGHYLAPLLIKKSYKIIGLGKEKKSNHNSIYYQSDLQNTNKLLQILKKHKPNQIYHLAGIFRGHNEQDFVKNNFLTTLNLLATINQIKGYKPHILLVGSFAEYGNLSKKQITEQDSGEIANFYGLSKKMQTELGIFFAKTYNLKINIVRPSTLIGPGAPNVMLTGNLIQQIKQGITKIKINNMDVTRDSLDIRDAVHLYWLINTSHLKGEVINACFGKPLTNRHLALEIKKRVEQKIEKIITFDENKKNFSPIKISVGSNKKAKKIFNWQPRISFTESINFIFEQELNLCDKK